VRQQHVFTLIRTGMEEAGPTRAGKSRAMHYKWLRRVQRSQTTLHVFWPRTQNWTEFKKKWPTCRPC